MRTEQMIDRKMAGTKPASPDPALKGKWGKNCNRTACQAPFAFFFNSGTTAYYCFQCAVEIRKWEPADNPLFPSWQQNLSEYKSALGKEAE